jgi:metacaspase-1
VSNTKRRNVRRKALLVGINNYENPANNLQGCVPDAQDFASTLKMYGFPASKQKMLINEQATTDNILSGLEWLCKDLAAGDVCIFYYSGHGSQVADLNNEEQDRYDEIICPYDISWYRQKYITDDQLYEKFTKQVPEGVRIDVLLDSCFSGSATRQLIVLNRQSLRQRYLVPPVEHRNRLTSMVPSFTDASLFGKRSVFGPDVVEQNNVLWSGCQEDQVSWELSFAGQVRGAFTYYFCTILREFGGNLTRRELYTALRERMYNDGFEQIPNLEAPSEDVLEIFPFRKASEIDRTEELSQKKR